MQSILSKTVLVLISFQFWSVNEQDFVSGDLKQRRTDLKMTSTSSVKMSDEMRRIIDDYSATLNKATLEIKALTKEKTSLEKAYGDLMGVNEKLIKDLVRF